MTAPSRLKLPEEARALLARAASLGDEPLWLVGGAPRDALLGRPVKDLDLACADAETLARKTARALRGTLVVLDEANAVYRVVLGPSFTTVRQLDFARLQGRGIEEDLARRDFTVNALALRLSKDGLAEEPLDLRGGLNDLAARLVRCESPEILKDDPLRLLRAFRVAAQLGFSIEPKTLELVRELKRLIKKPAGERIQAELLMLLAQPGSAAWLNQMEKCGILTEVFDELKPARTCAQIYYGPGGVMTHSLEVASRADFLLSNLTKVYPALAAAIEQRLRNGAQGDVPLRSVLILTALLHDVAKPETAKSMGGRLRFFQHDIIGAKRVEQILKRLKFSNAHVELAAAVTRHHLRPGHLAAGAAEMTDKACYRFYRDLGEHALATLLVCWADHASYLPEKILLKLLKAAAAAPGESLGRVPEEARKTVRHLQVVSHLLQRLLQQPHRAMPKPLLDGHAVMRALCLPPGPAVGKCLEQLREAQAAGKIHTPEEALKYILKASKGPTKKAK